MNGSLSATQSVRPIFNSSSQNCNPRRRKRLPPVSIRFSEQERTWLEEQAGDIPVSRYVKDAILSGSGISRRPKRRIPVKDHQALAQVLSMLGRSETGRVLGGILFALELGQLELEEETEAGLRAACADVAAMRGALMKALDLPIEDTP